MVCVQCVNTWSAKACGNNMSAPASIESKIRWYITLQADYSASSGMRSSWDSLTLMPPLFPTCFAREKGAWTGQFRTIPYPPRRQVQELIASLDTWLLCCFAILGAWQTDTSLSYDTMALMHLYINLFPMRQHLSSHTTSISRMCILVRQIYLYLFHTSTCIS